MKKLFISADIEGTCGIAAWEETDAAGRNYAYFCQRMTAEVDAAARGAEQAGYITTVKDAHDSARNIDANQLPEATRIMRGWTGDPLSMMRPMNSISWPAVNTPSCTR